MSEVIDEIVTRVLETGPQFDHQLAESAFRWSSMTPDARGKQIYAEYLAHIAEVAKTLDAIAQNPDQRAILENELRIYKDRYLSRLNAWLSAHSRTASTFVTGAAKFNHRRNQKANDTEGRRLNELLEWSKTAQKNMRNAILALRTDDQLDEENWKRLKYVIDENIAVLVAIDRRDPGIRGFLPNSFRNSITSSIRNTAKRGDQAMVDRALEYLSETQRQLGITAITPRHSIWSLKSGTNR